MDTNIKIRKATVTNLPVILNLDTDGLQAK